MRKTQRDVVGEVVRGLVDVLNERLHSSQSAGTQHHESTQQGPMTVQHTPLHTSTTTICCLS